MAMLDNYYVNKYFDKWNALYAKALMDEADDPCGTATMEFEECCNTEEVVGYYLVYHKEFALQDWIDNTAGIEMTARDKEIDRILKDLFKEV